MEKISNENLNKIKGKCGIYKITIERYTYIGSSNNIANRLRSHRNSLLGKCHHNHTMQNCFNKYGLEALMFEIIEECEESALLQREAYYMETLHPNMNHIMDPTRPTPTEESIKLGIETRKRNDRLLNRRPSNIKKVYQYDISGNFIREWDAASDAANFYECQVSALCACCNNKTKTCCGFRWSYKMEDKTAPIKNRRGNIIIQYDCNMSPVMLWPSFEAIRKDLHISHSIIKKVSKTVSIYKNSYWVVNPETIEDFENLPLNNNPVLKCKKFENNNQATSKIVYQYDMEGHYLGEFPSVKEAGRCLNVNSRSIGLCASGKYEHYKSAHGYRWSYVKEEKLSAYINNSSKAVSRPVIVFDVLTGEEKEFENIAEAVRNYEPNSENFSSSCSTLCACANNKGYYLSRYLAKNIADEPYVLTDVNTYIYNSTTNKIYKNSKEAAADTGISSYSVKKLCIKEENNEWLYINQCARVKLRESRKLFVERQP